MPFAETSNAITGYNLHPVSFFGSAYGYTGLRSLSCAAQPPGL